jgi:hypothetical protein
MEPYSIPHVRRVSICREILQIDSSRFVSRGPHLVVVSFATAKERHDEGEQHVAIELQAS